MTRVGRTTLVLLSVIVTAHLPAAGAAEIDGTIERVQDNVVTIRTSSTSVPKVGDRFEVSVEIPGLGPAEVAQGRVTQINGKTIVGAIEESSSPVKLGQQVTIHSQSRPPGTVARVPTLVGRTAKSAKEALASAGLRGDFRIGEDPPPTVAALTVYAQDPAPNSTASRDSAVVVMLYAPTPTRSSISEIMPRTAGSTDDPRDSRFPPWPGIRPDQPWLGASYGFIWKKGYIVYGLLKEGAGAQAGLQVGDIIQSINGEEIDGFIANAIAKLQAGQKTTLRVERDGEQLDVPVELQPIPPDGGNGRILAAAEEGEVWAMTEIGQRIVVAGTDGFPYLAKEQQDLTKGTEWLKRAADAGSAYAAAYLAGSIYGYLNKNPDESIQYYERARSLSQYGDIDGIYEKATKELADGLFKGEKLPLDQARAVKLYRELAEHGDVESAHKLGELYKDGTGVPLNLKESVRWYHVAAKAGYSFAQQEMGQIAYEGRGVQQNYEVARGWFELAAERHRPFAMLKLGEIYELGRGVEPSYVRARDWYQRALDDDAAGFFKQLSNLALSNLQKRADRDLESGTPQSRRLAIEYYQAGGDSRRTSED